MHQLDEVRLKCQECAAMHERADEWTKLLVLYCKGDAKISEASQTVNDN
jgi:hypothetical protein